MSHQVAAITPAMREAMYKRIFSTIPRSFLKPEHPHNRAIVGAIAYMVAYIELLAKRFTDDLFLDSAAHGRVGEDGQTGLSRWGVWLKMPQLNGETPDAYRLRLMQRLFTPKTTIAAIEGAIEGATGLAVTIVENVDLMVTLDDGPIEGKKLMGSRYGPMSIDVVTEGPTNVVPGLMSFLRAAGVHWCHLERVRHWIELSLNGEQAGTIVRAWTKIGWWPAGFTPDGGLLDVGPIDPGYLGTGGASRGADYRIAWGARSMLLAGDINAPIITVVASNRLPAAFPVLNWDDTQTLWNESVWGD